MHVLFIISNVDSTHKTIFLFPLNFSDQLLVFTVLFINIPPLLSQQKITFFINCMLHFSSVRLDSVFCTLYICCCLIGK